MMIIWCLVTDTSSIAHIIFSHFRLFFTLLSPWQLKKSKFWKNENHSWRYYHFTHDYHKSKSYNVWLRYGTWHTKFFLILDHFLPFYPSSPLTTQNQKFEKNEAKPWRHHHFTQVYHKLQSSDIWFLRYQLQQTDFFVILGHFLAFCPLKAKNWK